MITSLKLSNFKGHNRSFDLGKATMIVGDNFRGKSGVFQAAALLIHGWLKHPGGDKKLDPYGLASGNPMSVTGTVSGREILRQWERDNRGSIRYTGYDGEPLCPPIFLDARTYFDLSPDKRMRFVFGAVKLASGEFSAAKLIADLKNLKADPQTQAHEEALKEVVRIVSDSWEEKQLVSTVQEWLGTIIEDLKEKAKLAKQAADRMVKTVAGITELQLRDTTEIDANTAALEQQASGLRTRLETISADMGRIEQRGETAKEQAAHVERIRQELAALPVIDATVLAGEAKLQADALHFAGELQKLNQELGRLEAELTRARESSAAQAKAKFEMDALDAELAKSPDQTDAISALSSEVEELGKELDPLDKAISDAATQREQLHRPLSDLKSTLHAAELSVREAQTKLDTLATATECPWCACSGSAFREAAKVHFESVISTGNAQVSGFQREIKDTEKRMYQLAATIEETSTRRDNLRATSKDRGNRISSLIAKQAFRGTLLARREGLTVTANDIDVAAAEKALETHRSTLVAFNTSAENIKKELATLAGMKRAQELAAQIPPAIEDVEALTSQWRALKEEKVKLAESIATLDAEIKQGIAAKSDALRQNQAVAERDKAKAELDMTKQSVATVSDFQQKLVDNAFGQIIADANRFVTGILDSPLVYREGEIGRMSMRNGREVFVSHEYLSGTEQALCFAGISVALAMQASFRLVMIDEMTRLSAKNKALVLERMHLLIEGGFISQFIGVDVDESPYQPMKANHSDAIQFIKL